MLTESDIDKKPEFKAKNIVKFRPNKIIYQII